MTTRNQRILFWALVVCIVSMGLLLGFERQRYRDRISSLADATPLDAPGSATETITLDLADDAAGVVKPADRQIALPTETTARARALVDHLVAEYAQTGSTHPLPSGAAVDGVFLLPLPLTGHAIDPNAHASGPDGVTSTIPVPPAADALQPQSPGGELAVINLRSSFVNAHPSGVEVEALTLLSIVGTLHANLPQIEQIRFLVDGQPRETLAGHADMLRTYPSRDTTQTDSTDVQP